MTATTRGGLTRFRPVGPGSRVGLVAPASPFARADFEAGLAELARLELVPVYDGRVFEREPIVAGPASLRAAMLREYWARPDIDAVLAVRGGSGSAETLPFLDASACRAARTAFIGYSDVTALHTFLTCHAGMTSVHGPMIEGRLAVGETAYDRASLLGSLSETAIGELAPAGLEILRSGESAGPLFGGTLTQLTASMGTPYRFDPPAGYVLLLDEVGERPYRIRRMLTQFVQGGLMAGASAVVVGQLPRCDEPRGGTTAFAVVADVLRGFSGPVIAGFPTGHATAPLLSVPLGVAVRVVGRDRPALVFDEAGGVRVIGGNNPMARIHFIGICGTAMATFAAMMKSRGHAVQGSDMGVYPPMSEFLVREGIAVFDGYRAEQITPDIDRVVVGNAISRGNPELEEVLDRKVRFTSLPEAIRDEFLWHSRAIVIAGTHGKTTTTALAGWLLTACGRDPSVLVGGIAVNLDGSYRLGSGRDFVIEGDEYDSAFFDKTAKFLKYLPDIAVVGNLEYDHADIYADMEALRTAFRRFVGLMPRQGRLMLGADSPEAMRLAAVARCRVETFGVSTEADWRASGVTPDGDRTAFDLTVRGERLGPVAVPLWGEHNVRNTLAALAVGEAAGLTVEEMTRALQDFRGVRRRLELRGVARGVSVFDDFAHHPTAILETLRAVRWSYPDRRLWAIFEPRSATSCRRIFQDDFTQAFEASGADEVILASVFRASLPEDERLSVDEIVGHLRAAGRRARHIATVAEIVATVAREAGEGDLVVIMSNGGFDGIHDKLLSALGEVR